MKKIKQLIILSSIIISCGEMETVIDLDIPPQDPVLVLNGRLDTDTFVKVLISSSVGAFDNASPQIVNDANVVLFEDNVEINRLEIDFLDSIFPYSSENNWSQILMFYYKFDYKPIKNKTYKIEVTHPNFNNISGSTYIPNDIAIKNITIDTTSNDDRINFQFSFDDNTNDDNYYALSLNVVCSKNYEEYYSSSVNMLSNDPSFPVISIFSGHTFSDNEVIFSDALFNGQEKNISIDVQYDEYKLGDCDTIYFEFSTFSNDAYVYYNSLQNQREGGVADIFGGEVVPVYTNITNGLGMLISRNVQKVYVKP